MSVYRYDYRILSSDADVGRRLRLSRLFTMLQEASIAHTTELGMGREKTLDRGLLWVVTMQQANIVRMPEYDETVRLSSWPGKMMHMLFPRYYRLEDMKGNALVEASALWVLMDRESRKMVFPDRCGVKIRGVHTGKESPLPSPPKTPAGGRADTFTVPYSYVDLNGHMNNTRYFDLAEDCAGAAAAGRLLRGVCVEYQNEARLGETLHLRWGGGDGVYLCGETERPVFRMRLEYV